MRGDNCIILCSEKFKIFGAIQRWIVMKNEKKMKRHLCFDSKYSSLTDVASFSIVPSGCRRDGGSIAEEVWDRKWTRICSRIQTPWHRMTSILYLSLTLKISPGPRVWCNRELWSPDVRFICCLIENPVGRRLYLNSLYFNEFKSYLNRGCAV